MIRGITGFGEGNGPYIAIHDGFNLGLWAGFLPGSDRIALDTHPYLAFDGSTNSAPIVTDDGLGEPGGTWPSQACAWGSTVNQRSDLFGLFWTNQTLIAFHSSQTTFGLTVSGEFSSSYVDCGLFVSGVGVNTTNEGDCLPFVQWQNFNATFKQGIMDFTMAEMDSLHNWWFWTWKVCFRSGRRKLLDIKADSMRPLTGW
jgi:glucan 1,3-beta-glucosidase